MKTNSLHEAPGQYGTKAVVLDGHRYPVDPMSDEFDKLLMECFIAGKKKALARASHTKAAKAVPQTRKADSSRPSPRVVKSPAAGSAKPLPKKPKLAWKDA